MYIVAVYSCTSVKGSILNHTIKLCIQQPLINPRRACAARVTVLGCVSVSVCYHVFCHRAQQCTQQDIPAASAGHEQSFKNGVFLRSEVMASFAYRESHRRYYRDLELIPSTAQGYKVVQKPNRALNHAKRYANAMQRAQ